MTTVTETVLEIKPHYQQVDAQTYTTMSATLAGPPTSCCWTGIKHTGTPEGRIESLGGLDTYIAEPPAAAAGLHKKVLLFLANIWGPLFINNKLLQDYFASSGASRLSSLGNVWRVLTWGWLGFIVLGPDYFFGVPVQDLPEGYDKRAFAQKARTKAVEVFPKWFDAVKAKYGEKTHHPSSSCSSSSI